ncbi:transcription-repair-coupling factor [Bacteroidia bacterium]|nr:transcription-repair-coupling factor [Bacteroidia bacterium]
MKVQEIIEKYRRTATIEELLREVRGTGKIQLNNYAGSITSVFVATLATLTDRSGETAGSQSVVPQIVILNDKEEAAYFYNDLLALTDKDNKGASIAFLSSSFKRAIDEEEKDNDAVLIRTEILERIVNKQTKLIVTYPEALAERVIDKNVLTKMSMTVHKKEKLSLSFLENLLNEYGFTRSDFVFEPGQYSIRGGIVDIYSYAEELPVRIDFFGNEVESIRFFDIETQLSEKSVEQVSIVPDLSHSPDLYKYTDLFDYFDIRPIFWIQNGNFVFDRIASLRKTASPNSNHILSDEAVLFDYINKCTVIEWGGDFYFKGKIIDMQCSPQPLVHKDFEIFATDLQEKINEGYEIYICSTNEMQIQRLRDILSDKGYKIQFQYVEGLVHEGFTDNAIKICLYTEHQIFERYHKYQLQTNRMRKNRESLTINELHSLHQGDYVVHIDHGIGQFAGLCKIDNNGTAQEVIRLTYKNNAELFVGLYSLHKISKYRGKDGEPPAVNRLGGDAWNRLKQRAKSKVKDIARELIVLYAKRREETAFSFSADSYLQEEMEASFVYEETPDQIKAIDMVKHDMESPHVMDRLICGDVGFGKTEVAIRAAFKAVADSKQVAVLVPTTILAFQHYTTFSERLKGMPCKVEYISRMRNASDTKHIIEGLKNGTIDIIIGTHKLATHEITFKDLGLLIIDEEQKFGVGMKEKLKRIKLNVDTLTMTATPIPRTLQFSLMGARDMSVIRTPPPNRYPIVTELHRFNEKIITEAITYEVARQGQIFFIHDRVDNLPAIQSLLHRLMPQIKTCIVHGQMDGTQMERTMHDFIRGDYDVLIATTIIESGLDIPNANTIIINQAHNYGLSDLHQLRGRVGRSSKKAFCYLLTPSLDSINSDARRRLKAIEDFSGLGSGFSIAMQDLDIRGAGNILGAEQSGFIEEIGYETYQRILNEALFELRTEEFTELPKAGELQGNEPQILVQECVIETDFEVMLPETYIESTSERIKLYRELDNLSDDQGLLEFEQRLSDRFGPVPPQVKWLMEIVRIRKKCVEMGIERLIARKGKAIVYFISDKTSPFYASPTFYKILEFVQLQVMPCTLNEKNDKLSLTFSGISNVDALYTSVEKMYTSIFGKVL